MMQKTFLITGIRVKVLMLHLAVREHARHRSFSNDRREESDNAADCDNDMNTIEENDTVADAGNAVAAGSDSIRGNSGEFYSSRDGILWSDVGPVVRRRRAQDAFA